jgi:hypothetical protein
MTSTLAQYQQMFLADKELSKLVPFQIREKGQDDKARVEIVMQHEGTDAETIEILRLNHNRWLQDPSSFWICPPMMQTGHYDPQAQIVSRYLQTNSDNA